MECSCTVEVDIYDDGPSCHHEKIQTANKKHQCCECGKRIIPGEKYEYAAGIWDSKAHVYKTCLDCKSLRDVFFDAFSYTEIWECFYDEFGSITPEVPESCISKLTPGARAKVCEYIEDCWSCD